MEKYEEIEKGIETKDLKRLRNAVGAIIYTDRDFSGGEFDEVIRYVEGKGIKLKEDSLVGDPAISSTKTVYTDKDFSRAIFELEENFCDERIEDVKKIGKALYGKKTTEKHRGEPERVPHPQTSPSGNTHPNSTGGHAPKKPESQTPKKIGVLAVIVIVIAIILKLVSK